MKKLLLILLTLLLVSCNKKNDEKISQSANSTKIENGTTTNAQNNQNNTIIIDKQNEQLQEELNNEENIENAEELIEEEDENFGRGTAPFVTYNVPGVNISFQYPNHINIKNININKESYKFNSDEDIRINISIYGDEFFEHGERTVFNPIFVEQFESDGEHINKNNILRHLNQNEENVLLKHSKKDYPYTQDFYYNDMIVGEDRIKVAPHSLDYDLIVVLDGYLVQISCSFFSYKNFEIINNCPTYFTFEEANDSYYFTSQQAEDEFIEYLFSAQDEQLGTILLCYKNIVNCIRETIYIPQYENLFYEQLVNAGFNSDAEYRFIGGHSPKYMFIWTNETVNEKAQKRLYLFEDKILIGYYDNIINAPFFQNSMVDDTKTMLCLDYNLASSTMLTLEGLPTTLTIDKKEYPLIRM